MEYVNLDKLVWFQEGPGVRNYQYVDKGIKLINVTNLVNGKLKLHLTNRFISEEEANGKYKHFMCDIGDLVIASSGITYDTLDKKIAFVTEKDLPLCMNTSVIRFKPLDNNVCLDFIYYFLKSKKYKNQISKLMTGSAQLNYGPSHLHKVKIPLYSFDKQLKIAKELKKIDSTILICHNNLENLDNIVKSQFIEMFGDDLKGETIKLSDLSEVITKGTTPTTLGFDFVDDGINFIKIECISDSYQFSKNKMLHITAECDEKLRRSRLKENDILFSIAGAIGRTAIVTNDILPANTNQALAIIRLKKNSGLNVDFLNEMLHTELITKQVASKANGAAQINLSLTDVGNFKVIVPFIERQTKFSKFIHQIDKSKYFEGGIP